MATTIDEACREMVDAVDGALACAVFELGSGALLGRHPHGGVLPDVAVQAAADLLQRASREVHVSSTDREYLARTLESRSAGLLLVMKKTTNVGMGYAQLRAASPLFQPLVSDDAAATRGRPNANDPAVAAIHSRDRETRDAAPIKRRQ